MTKQTKVKAEMVAMEQLEGLTSALEQTAAQTIAHMRSAIINSRPFFSEVWRIYGIIKQTTLPPPEVVHKHLIVVIGIDWGMPGNLLSRVVTAAVQLQKEHDADMLAVGKITKALLPSDDGHTTLFFTAPKNAVLEDILPIYKVVAGYARVTVVYPSFQTLAKQTVSSVSFSTSDYSRKDVVNEDVPTAEDIAAGRFIIEPSPQDISNYLNEAVVGLTLRHYFAEATLAYSAAQMVAMRHGHENAKTTAQKLRLRYYKAHREEIDTKLREITGSRSNAHAGGAI